MGNFTISAEGRCEKTFDAEPIARVLLKALNDAGLEPADLTITQTGRDNTLAEYTVRANGRRNLTTRTPSAAAAPRPPGRPKLRAVAAESTGSARQTSPQKRRRRTKRRTKLGALMAGQ